MGPNTDRTYSKHVYSASGFLILFLVSIAKFNSAQPSETESWKLAKDKDSILIYTRQMNGMKIKEFKAYTTINTTVDKLVAVLQDVDNYDKWTMNVKNSALLKKISDDETYIYSEADIPWPFSNRDIISHINIYWSQTRDTATLVIDGIPDYLPEKKGIIRIPISKGAWHIYQVAEENVAIEYSYAADPGGSIPAWIVNLFIVDGPYKTLLRLKTYIE